MITKYCKERHCCTLITIVLTIEYCAFNFYFTFFLDEKSNKKIKPEYFYPKNHRKHFSIATPAARAPHSTRGSLPPASAKILRVIFWSKSIRAGLHCHADVV
jgi:hypothetical protein